MNFGGQSKCHFVAANPQLRHNLHVINMGLQAHPQSDMTSRQIEKEREKKREKERDNNDKLRLTQTLKCALSLVNI